MNRFIEEDKLVSDFMGYFKYDPTKERKWTKEDGWRLSRVRFRSSYDWLLPAYYKIVKIMEDETDEEVYTPEAVAQFNVVIDALTDTDNINDLFNQIVRFIQIYNDQERHKTEGDS